MIGRVYVLRGEYWRVLARWRGRGPRNVLVERVEPCRRDDGQATYCPCGQTGWYPVDHPLVVRPFRGLRRTS